MKRPDRGSLVQWAGVLAVLVLVGWTLLRVQLQGAQVEALSAALGDEQSAAEARGETPVAPSPDDLIEDPDYRGPQGPPGPPPTDEAVYAAVESYFLEHPVEDGRTPSAAEVAAAVSAYLTENPPEPGEPGPPPSAEQVAAAVEAYLTANPPAPGEPGEDGEDGAQGPPGPGPAPEDIAAAVQAYIEEHPLPMCPEGSSAEAITVLTSDGATDVVTCVIQEQEEN